MARPIAPDLATSRRLGLGDVEHERARALAFGVVSAVVGAVVLVGLLAAARWGRIAAIVVAALNLLLDVPGVVVGATALIKVAAAVSAVLCVVVIVSLVRRRHVVR